jgi:cyclophilin family peptidyl-prolyl cis-trans isomerase
VQFGISYSHDRFLSKIANTPLEDDPQLNPPIPFDEGVVSFAGSGPNSRTSHLFIAYGPVKSFGKMLWETPIGTVIEGMDTVRNLYSEYGEKPEQGQIHKRGVHYIRTVFPKLDKIIHCSVEQDEVLEKGTEELKSDVAAGNQDSVKSKSELVKSDSKASDVISEIKKEDAGTVKSDVKSDAAGIQEKSRKADNRLGKSSSANDTVASQTGLDHLGFPIAAAIGVFLVIMCMLKRKRSKKTMNKTV